MTEALVAKFRKGDKVRWNALALHGDDRNGWTVEGLDEAKALFPIYRVRKGKQTGSAVQSDLEPCPIHARLQREAQTSGAMAEDSVPTAEEYTLFREAYAETYPVRPLLNAIDAKDAEIERLRSVALAARALVQSVQPSLDADLEVVSESKLTELESMLELAGFGEE